METHSDVCVNFSVKNIWLEKKSVMRAEASAAAVEHGHQHAAVLVVFATTKQNYYNYGLC